MYLNNWLIEPRHHVNRIYIPKTDINPQIDQMTKLIPMDPECARTIPGVTNMPDPLNKFKTTIYYFGDLTKCFIYKTNVACNWFI